jgi:hypothetical protein
MDSRHPDDDRERPISDSMRAAEPLLDRSSPSTLQDLDAVLRSLEDAPHHVESRGRGF